MGDFQASLTKTKGTLLQDTTLQNFTLRDNFPNQRWVRVSKLSRAVQF